MKMVDGGRGEKTKDDDLICKRFGGEGQTTKTKKHAPSHVK